MYLWWPARSLESATPAVIEAWGGVNAERGRLPPAAIPSVQEGRARAYLGHLPGRFPLYLEREQVDAARTAAGGLGARPGELFEQDTWEALRELALDHFEVGSGGPVPWDFLSLGDELSFAPWGDPLEFAPSPGIQASFDRWRLDRGRERFPLERATWRRALSTASPEELAAFIDRRRFEREWFTARIAWLSGEFHRMELGDVGVLGLYGSPAFGGLAIDSLVSGLRGPQVEVSEPYPEGLARRRVASVAHPEHRWLTTLFLDAEDPLRDPCVELWRTWAEGCDGYVIWNAGHVDPPTERSARLLSELDALRALASDGEWDWPGPERVALLVDDDQVAFEWLQEVRRRPAEGAERLGGWYEEHGRGPRLRRAWIAALERIGLQPGVLRPEALPGRARFTDLIALEQTWLGSDQAARIGGHLESGGRLWMLGDCGSLDERARRRATSLGEAWREAYPEQAFRLRPLSTAGPSSGDLDTGAPRLAARLRASGAELPVEPPSGWWVRRGWRRRNGERAPVVCLFRGEVHGPVAPFEAADVDRAAASGWVSLHGPTDGVWVLQGPAER